jgi:circadian clock protein KaiB
MSAHAAKKCQLRLYIAGSTPNSARAAENLSAALDRVDGSREALGLEVVDVFAAPRRAVTDGVIVTPTLIGLHGSGRTVLIGDLTDTGKLHGLLRSLLAPA